MKNNILLAVSFITLTFLVFESSADLFSNSGLINGTTYIAEIQDKLFKIQNKITQLNIAVMTRTQTKELQRRIAAIEDEFQSVQDMVNEHNEELTNEISKCDESAIGFLRLFYSSLEAQIDEWRKTIRTKLQKEQDKVLMPVILSDIQSKYFEEAEKYLIQMDSREKTEAIMYEFYSHNMSNIPLAILFIQELQNITIVDYVISGLLHEIKANVHLSPYILLDVVKVLDKKDGLSDIREHAKNELVTVCSEKLKSSILTGKFRGNDDIFNLVDSLHVFNKTILLDILYRVVDEVYNRISKIRLVLFNNEHVGHIVEFMVYIYIKLKSNGDQDDNAMFAIAEYFRSISNTEHIYRTATDSDRIFVKNVINDFPSSLRNLYFSDKFSLVNVEYSEYLFAGTDFIINDKRYVLTSPFGGKLPYRSWSSVMYNNTLANEFIFGIHSKEYLYVSSTEYNPENLFVTTSTYGGDARIFQLELRNNSVAIKNKRQNRYLCATSMLFKEGKQFAFAAKYGHSGLASCQWRVVGA